MATLVRTQVVQLAEQDESLRNSVPKPFPTEEEREHLLWSDIDCELETVAALCEDHADSHRSPSLDHLPPHYDQADHVFETPPEYVEYQSTPTPLETANIQSPETMPSPSISNEKLRMDLDAVTTAVDRLYLVAPQLNNQRVELKSAKLAQMERARLEGPEEAPSLSSKGKKKARDRDMRDLDHMVELIGKGSERRMTDQSVVMDSRRMSKAQPTKKQLEEEEQGVRALNITYIAEYHETLKHVLVFVTVSGIPLGTELQAEVLPTSSSGTEGDWLVIRSSSASSPPLSLPVPVVPGKKNVNIRQGHYELKIGIANSRASRSSSPEHTPLMSAEQLLSLKPTTFTCISCSLPLVHGPRLTKYRDLPSEHWEELVDAWMCHTDQTLHDHVARHGRGFWPEESEALVGCSYILFQQSVIVNNNVSCTEKPLRGEDAWLARCICGAVIGRRHERNSPNGIASVTYRLFKYAVRPVSPIAEVPRFSMSAFIVQDMLEHVSAHATYRFVISDEEEEQPRLLIWLFKPNIRVSYMLPAPYVLPKQGTVDASKVLYRILGPSSSTIALKDLLARYPGFPQAEHLFYPIAICRKLAGLLTESTHSYPEIIKSMTGLDVGWLNRGS